MEEKKSDIERKREEGREEGREKAGNRKKWKRERGRHMGEKKGVGKKRRREGLTCVEFGGTIGEKVTF